MKPLDVLAVFRTKKEKFEQEVAATLASIARKEIEGSACTKTEAALIESGTITEAQLQDAIAALRRFDSKTREAVAVQRKFNIRDPQIKAAVARVLALKKELGEAQQMAASIVFPPDLAGLLAVVASAPALFSEFTQNGVPDREAIRQHVAKLADAAAERTAA